MRLEPGARLGATRLSAPWEPAGWARSTRARDLRLGRLVAIKFVSADPAADPVASERLAREARLTSLLNHPNIVTVHDVGTADGRPYIVMEFVAGQSLHAALQLQRVKPARAIEIASQIADGPAVAHEAGIVHRDLKPGNVMLIEDGRAKIVDFGLGKSTRPASGDEDPTTRTVALTDTMMGHGRLHGPARSALDPADPHALVWLSRDRAPSSAKD